MDLTVRTIAGLLGVSAALALGGCTGAVDWESFKAPDMSIFRPRSVAAVRESQLRPVTAEDLVDSEGRCAAPVASATPEPSPDQAMPQPATVPLIPAGIALEMTECDVVKRAGVPEKIQLGTNERNERTLTLTYINGERPGIYFFTSGRLTAMERAPEPPPKPKPPARRAKPKPKTANAN
jgi:hypothetical protein